MTADMQRRIRYGRDSLTNEVRAVNIIAAARALTGRGPVGDGRYGEPITTRETAYLARAVARDEAHNDRREGGKRACGAGCQRCDAGRRLANAEVARVDGSRFVAVHVAGQGWGVHVGGRMGKRIARYFTRRGALGHIEDDYGYGFYVTDWDVWRARKSASEHSGESIGAVAVA